jgi:uncharacterized protein (DUF697 family)
MAGISTIQGFWSIITEIDLRPLAAEAMLPVEVAILGKEGHPGGLLAEQMRHDPARPDVEVDTPVLLLDFSQAAQARAADVVILLLDGEQEDFSFERELAHALADAGKRVLVFVVLGDKPGAGAPPLVLPWRPRQAVYGPVDDVAFLSEKFVPAMIRLLPDRVLGLGRSFPLFRTAIGRYLINDTSQSNAAYSLATGLAEIVPILNIPLVVTDTVILTKNQAFLAYKLGLVFGFSTEWKDYLAEFGGVLGFGFLFRQFAHLLVGLIPGFGIIPKVGVAYAGTEIVGRTVLQWYLTGRHLTRPQLRSLYQQAYLRGKAAAVKLLPRFPQRKAKALPAGEARGKEKKRASRAPAKKKRQVCPQCGRTSAGDASFCQYCGAHFD